MDAMSILMKMTDHTTVFDKISLTLLSCFCFGKTKKYRDLENIIKKSFLTH